MPRRLDSPQGSADPQPCLVPPWLRDAWDRVDEPDPGATVEPVDPVEHEILLIKRLYELFPGTTKLTNWKGKNK